MRHSEYYERPMDAHDAGDVWMGEHRLNNLYTGSDYFVGPTHNERVFQVLVLTPIIFIFVRRFLSATIHPQCITLNCHILCSTDT